MSLRTQLLAYSNQLEERVRALYSSPAYNERRKSAQKADTGLLATFYGHLEALKLELRALVANKLPLPPANLPRPVIPSRASEAWRTHSLAHDWDRLSTAFQTSLAYRPQLQLGLPKAAQDRAKAMAPDFSGIRSFPEIDFAAMWTPFASVLPTYDASLLMNVHQRFEALQEAVRAMTLRDYLFSTHEEGNHRRTMTRRQSFVASQQAFARQLESIVESVKAKGGEVRTIGHARASSVVKAAWDAEEHFYAAACELARGGQRLINYEQLPVLWRNNEHILSGYRFIPKERWGSLLKSTFQIHNETGNIMTHLIGALIVLPLFWPSKERFDDQATPMDRMVQTIYLGAALKCLLLSVSWHVMSGCADACLFERFACVDYTGIAWLVAASVWTLVYNQFYCQPNLAMVYSLTTFVVGLVGAVVPWASWFNERRNKPLRIAVFLTMCFTALAPFTHSSLAHGFVKTAVFASPIVPSLAAYIFGLVFYATQFPESFWPGRFDVVGHAHQIWHISIVVAILLHHRATFYWHQERFNFSCAAPSPSMTGGAADALTASSSAIFDAFINAVAPLLSTNPLAIMDVNLADEKVHGWRISAGTVGGGLVGRVWDWCVDGLMNTFAT